MHQFSLPPTQNTYCPRTEQLHLDNQFGQVDARLAQQVKLGEVKSQLKIFDLDHKYTSNERDKSDADFFGRKKKKIAVQKRLDEFAE